MTTTANVVNQWVLGLQGITAKTDEFLMYALADNSAEGAQRVEDDIKAAKPGEFVDIEVRFVNMMDSATVHVQPHVWGLWCVVERTMPATEMFGRTNTG